jgi:membrane-associated protease RseP (regulator of RpoE activity)
VPESEFPEISPEILEQSSDQPPHVVVVRPPKQRAWVHVLLFLLTCLTTLIVGARLQQRFDAVQPLFLGDSDFFPLRSVRHPAELLQGLPFSASLLAILFAHEMGHYLTALKYRVYATLPFFLPAPTPIGTFGAFIQIRSRFHRRSELLDIAVGGPIAGFVLALPLAVFGLMRSKVVQVDEGTVMGLGSPLIFDLIQRAFHLPAIGTLLFHPVALAAWVGMLATALNLLPGGQLDGGHIVYSLSPRLHRYGTLAGAAALLLAAYYLWSGWLIWAVAFLITRRHPRVLRPEPHLPRSRRTLAWLALLLLVLTAMPVPIESGSLREAWAEYHSHQR